jgi:hypothetical protein
VQDEVDEDAERLRVQVVADLACALRLLDARSVRQHELALAVLQSLPERRIRPRTPHELEVHGEP